MRNKTDFDRALEGVDFDSDEFRAEEETEELEEVRGRYGPVQNSYGGPLIDPASSGVFRPTPTVMPYPANLGNGPGDALSDIEPWKIVLAVFVVLMLLAGKE